jgi:hypothetical protein
LIYGGIAVRDEAGAHLLIRTDMPLAFRTGKDVLLDIRGFVLWKLSINPRNQLS